jgi:hypothetical protein
MGAEQVESAWRHAWRPVSRLGTQSWAEKNLNLKGAYARSGRFRIEGSRYLSLPMALNDDERVRMINLLKATQTAGSLAAEIAFHKLFDTDPCTAMITFQSDDDAEENYLTRIETTFQATECNRHRFAQLKRKRALFRWPHMQAFIQGANLNSLQNKSVKFEWNDEVWCWKPGMLEEAFNRTRAYRRTCKIFNVSQGGNTGSEWEIVWTNGRRYQDAVHCLKCGHEQPRDFFAHMLDDENVKAGIVWDKRARLPDGRWNITRCAETARFRCRKCGHDHEDTPEVWHAFDRRSSYICLDPEKAMTDCSVRWTALVLGSYGALVKKFLEACEVRDGGSTVALEKFYKKDLALFWNPLMGQEKIQLRTGEYLMEAPFSPGYAFVREEWMRLVVITADYQQGKGNDTRHLIVVVRAWGVGRSRLLWQGRVNTFEQLHQLETLMGVMPACVCVDGSFEMMEVAAQCAKYGWTMLIGDDPEFFTHRRKDKSPQRLPYSERFRVDPEKGRAGQGRRFCWAFRWSNPSIKNMLWNLRHGLTSHQWEVAQNVSADYREGIDAEVKKRIITKKTGMPQHVWVQLIDNNHPWDCECEQVVVAVVAGLLTFDVEAEETKSGQSEEQSPRSRRTGPVAPHQVPEQLELISS